MDDETNVKNGRSSASKTKPEPVNNQDDLNLEDVKLKQEDATGSEASNMVLDNDSDCEKSNAKMKRSNRTPTLLVSKLPKHFSSQQIKEYLEKLCGPCGIKDLKENDDGKAVTAIFRNMQQMTAAKKILNSEAIDGANITVTDADEDMDQDEGPPVKRKKEEEEDEGPWGLDMDVWRPDPKGLYGVKPEYLTTLGVNDTLRNWVLVLNFRCGKEELREVMELAGTVLVCSVHNRRSSHNANVMYSHPLEALQAISMLNGQMLYSRPLTVKMLKSNGAVLPKGLTNIGPGLAKYGKPLRDIVRHYERFVKGQACGLNMNLFRTPEQQATQEAENITEGEDSKKRAKIAMENLVSEGIDIKDLVFALKELLAEHKEEEKEHLISELNDSDDGSARESSSSNNMVLIRCNSNDGNISPSASPDPEIRPKTKSTPQHPCLASLPPSSESDSISVLPNSLSGRSTPSSSLHRRPGNPMRPTGNSSSSNSSYGSSRHMGPVSAHMPPVPGIISNPCSQIYPPSSPRNAMPMRPVGNPMFGPGPMSGPSRLAPMPGPITSPISRPVPMTGPRVSPMAGPMGGPMSGQMSGQMSGPMGGPSGPMTGQGRLMSGLQPPGTNFSMPGPNTHPPFGPTVQPTSGPGASLQFSNLPPSTTFALLSDKLAQVGQLVSIQFTVPGCVVAKYAHRSHAEACIKQFDKTCLDGNIIDVRFI